MIQELISLWNCNALLKNKQNPKKGEKMEVFKILGICAVLAMPVYAADDTDIIETEVLDENAIEEVPVPRAVVARMSCADINKRVSELREDVKMYPELAADLKYMLARQRTQCAALANRRPVHNYENVNPVQYFEEPDAEEFVEEQVIEEVEPESEVVEKTPEEIAAEQELIAENRAKGLCDDGEKPNRYGCCAGEKFKEVSQMKFACCPKYGDGDCVEPRKKN